MRAIPPVALAAVRSLACIFDLESTAKNCYTEDAKVSAVHLSRATGKQTLKGLPSIPLHGCLAKQASLLA